MQRRDFLTTAGLALAAARAAAGQDNSGARLAAGAPYFDVRRYGARGDGKVKDTAAIQRAVDACAAAGGGLVCLSPAPTSRAPKPAPPRRAARICRITRTGAVRRCSALPTANT